MNEQAVSPKVSIGPTTVLGSILSIVQLLGGVALLVYGKSAPEREAGLALLGTGGTGQLAVIVGRMAQAAKIPASVFSDASAAIGKAAPTLEQELASVAEVERPESARVPDGAQATPAA